MGVKPKQLPIKLQEWAARYSPDKFDVAEVLLRALQKREGEAMTLEQVASFLKKEKSKVLGLVVENKKGANILPGPIVDAVASHTDSTCTGNGTFFTSIWNLRVSTYSNVSSDYTVTDIATDSNTTVVEKVSAGVPLTSTAPVLCLHTQDEKNEQHKFIACGSCLNAASGCECKNSASEVSKFELKDSKNVEDGSVGYDLDMIEEYFDDI